MVPIYKVIMIDRESSFHHDRAMLRFAKERAQELFGLAEKKDSAQKKIFVLSIDSGGIRGIIPALILEDVEQSILQKHKIQMKPLHTIFDLICGTSSGGLTAMLLSSPVSSPITTLDLHRPMTPREIVETYETLGSEVFPSGRFRIIGHAFTGKYSATALEKLLKTTFGNQTNEAFLTNLLVPSYDNERKTPHLFTSVGGTEGVPTESEDNQFYLRDIARATTALPTYFSPALVHNTSGSKAFSLSDGSVFAHNPSLIAYSRIMELFPEVDEIHMLSLGTAPPRKLFVHKKIRDWGFVDWVNPAKGVPIYDLYSHAHDGIMDHYMKHLPKLHYYRIDMDQDDKGVVLDSTSPDNIKKIKELGHRLIQDHRSTIKEFVEQL